MPVNLSIHSNIRDYVAVIEETTDFMDALASHPQACFIVDENVWKIYSKTLLAKLPIQEVVVLPINEDKKNLSLVEMLYDRFVEQTAKRNLTVISIGGGILQDITGFAASTIYRGVNWIFVPTTFLAQADSCIGSKTSLNYRSYKNLIGTFFPPTRIHIYTPFLQTLSDSDFYSGFGEIIKLHLMGGQNLYYQLKTSAHMILKRDPEAMFKSIHQSLQVKLTYMEGDEFDTGRRNLLNFGHDFGHALESTSHFDVPHGQAVIFGMLTANIISQRRGLLNSGLVKEIAENLLLPNLVVRPAPEALEPEAVSNAMKKDKKRTGDQLALIMMDANFEFRRINDLTPTEAASALDEAKKQLGY